MSIAHTLLAATTAGLVSLASAATGALENPSHLGIESGIGAITGWHCTSRDIEVRIDGVSIGRAGAGTSRADTQAACGRSDTGFSLLFNYALLRGGRHRVDAYADGLLFGSATFDTGYLGAEFVTGRAAAHEIPDFPNKGQKTKLSWSQRKQNLVIERVDSITAGSLVGSYSIRHISMLSSQGAASSLQPGVSVSGTWTFRADGTYTMSITLTAQGSSSSESADGTYSDHGHYMTDSGATALIVERGETLTLHAMAIEPTVASMVISMTRVPASSSLGLAADGGAPTAKRHADGWAAIASAISSAARD